MIRKKYYIIKKSNLYFKRIYIPIDENGIAVCVCSKFNCRFGEAFNELEIACVLCDSLSSNIYPRKYTYIYVDKN